MGQEGEDREREYWGEWTEEKEREMRRENSPFSTHCAHAHVRAGRERERPSVKSAPVLALSGWREEGEN